MVILKRSISILKWQKNKNTLKNATYNNVKKFQINNEFINLFLKKSEYPVNKGNKFLHNPALW